MMKALVLRADAGGIIGTGHFLRCLALAQEWQDQGGKVMFVTRCTVPSLLQRLSDECYSFTLVEEVHPHVSDLASMREALRSAAGGASALAVVDGYHFDSSYAAALRADGHRVLVIDDVAHLPAYEADVLLNQNMSAAELRYDVNEDADVLRGPRFALLRREFRRLRPAPRPDPQPVRRLFVTFGGTDPARATEALLSALPATTSRPLEVAVAVGADNAHAVDIAGRAAEIAEDSLQVHIIENPALAPWLSWADAAVSAAGTTAWELCHAGVATAYFVVAENQRASAEALAAHGAGAFLGDVRRDDLGAVLDAFLADSRGRAVIAARASKLVDGGGTGRVLQRLASQPFRLRHANAGDVRTYFDWANDPEVRRFAFHPLPIPWESHVAWFNNKLKDSGVTLYIAVNRDDIPLAQVRVEREGTSAELHVSIGAPHRGRGLSAPLLSAASKRHACETGLTSIIAHVKPENKASLRAFEKAGFEREALVEIHDQPAWVLRWRATHDHM